MFIGTHLPKQMRPIRVMAAPRQAPGFVREGHCDVRLPAEDAGHPAWGSAAASEPTPTRTATLTPTATVTRTPGARRVYLPLVLKGMTAAPVRG